jgi:hypothetical protein
MDYQKLYDKVGCKAGLEAFTKGMGMEMEHKKLFDGTDAEKLEKIAMIVKQHLAEHGKEYYDELEELINED